jgi:hypothetical protein
MRKVILAASAAALLLAPVSAVGQAPVINQPVDPAGQIPTVPVDVDMIIAAANNMESEVVGVANIQDTTKIFIVPVADFLTGAKGPELTSALQKPEIELQALRDALKANALITAELERNGLTVDQVVAIDVNDNNELLLFTEGAA